MRELSQRLHNYTTPFHTDKELLRLLNGGEALRTETEGHLSLISSYVFSDDLIDCIRIVTSVGTIYTFTKTETEYSFVKDEFISDINYYDIVMTDEIATNSFGDKFVVFGKAFMNYDTNRNMGRLLMYVNQNKLLEFYPPAIPYNGSVFITLNDIILSHANSGLVGKYLHLPAEIATLGANDILQPFSNDTILNVYKLSDKPLPGLSMVTFISRDSFCGVMDNYNMMSIALLVINVILSLISAYLLSVRLVLSLNALSDRIKQGGKVRAQDFLQSNGNEISILESCFDRFVEEINQLILQNRETERQKRKAEFATLRSQINPHFIYNALESISGMAKVKKQPEIQKVCVALGKYFRLGLHGGEEIVTIENEINHVKCYIEVERFRFPNKFEVEFDIESELLTHRMPKIILQPIVENAVHHAFNKLKRMGKITIKGKSEGNYIVFHISDNGTGLICRNPITAKRTDDNISTSGVGLANVNKRIEMEYGNGCGLSFESKPGNGTTVIVKILKSSARE